MRWRLHFEFVTSAQKPINFNVVEADETFNTELINGDSGSEESEEIFKLASDLIIETMAWDWYITVHSCNPHNIGLVSNVPSSSVSLIV